MLMKTIRDIAMIWRTESNDRASWENQHFKWPELRHIRSIFMLILSDLEEKVRNTYLWSIKSLYGSWICGDSNYILGERTRISVADIAVVSKIWSYGSFIEGIWWIWVLYFMDQKERWCIINRRICFVLIGSSAQGLSIWRNVPGV